MGGLDKPLMDWRGQPLVAHVLDRLRPQVDQVLIIANRNLRRYGAYTPTFSDDPLPSQGPLTGVLRGLQESATDWTMICPGDTPLIPHDLVAQLAAARKAASRVVFPYDAERPQHLHLLLHATMAEPLAAYLDGGHRSVEGWLQSLERRQVAPVSTRYSQEAFTNVNTPEQR